MKATPTAVLLCLALAFVACGDDSSSSASGDGDLNGPAPDVSAPEGPPPEKLVVEDLIKGKGAAAEVGDDLAVYFTAIRYVSGEHFETIWKPDKPFSFRLNEEDVNPGWVKGLPGMKVGGRRELIVPGPLTFRGGAPPTQDPTENTLIYVVDLLEVNGSATKAAGTQASDEDKPVPVQSPAEAAERTMPEIPPSEGPPPKKLVVNDLIEGTGRAIKTGDKLTIEYRSFKYATGEEWTNSWGPKPPFSFKLGFEEHMPGWEKGLPGMKEGGRRELIIPPNLLFLEDQAGENSPGTLIYVIDLLKIR